MKRQLKMKSDKLPDLGEFFKCFSTELVPCSEKLFAYIQKMGKVFNEWVDANITIILRERKDPHESKPISVLNTDCKILSFILANTLNEGLEDYTGLDWIKQAF